ncbi:hypothetical protein BJX99DRAFT_264631 [Aspergillus californicus]
MNFYFSLLLLATALIQLGGCIQGVTLESRVTGYPHVEYNEIGNFQEDMDIWLYPGPDCTGTWTRQGYKKGDGANHYTQIRGIPLTKSFKVSRELLPNEQLDISVPHNMNAWSPGYESRGNEHSCDVNIHQYTDEELGLGVNCYNSLDFTCLRFWVHG